MSGTSQELIYRVMRQVEPPAAPVEPVQWSMPGFAPMTRIACSFADVPAAALRERDQVRSRNGFIAIRRVRRMTLDQEFLSRHPDAQPIMIQANTFGPGKPAADIMVSPAQMISPVPGRLPVARRATECLSMPGVFRRPETGLSYTIIELDAPAEVCAEGLWCSTATRDSATH
ncbi:Hint domain-containing protein [Pseudoruegeria sp. HB172150]|uniref:Hint domain-containing protein n=1 Tax=Pseudoruegeria sp. HB172150 TaxID=2721164 RepID=UPI001557A439|nr:Hint domain-containing protein [Pseudoruegeria sp. HB172150]